MEPCLPASVRVEAHILQASEASVQEVDAAGNSVPALRAPGKATKGA